MTDLSDPQAGEMLPPAHVWAGEFGTAYTERNRVDWRSRLPFWADIMGRTGARSVLEVGCNAGWNLTAIRQAAPWSCQRGIDLNVVAVGRAQSAALDAVVATTKQAVELWGDEHELVFTAGVLIHVSPADLEQTMKDIVALSNRWVLSVEYESEAEAEVLYRGERNMLWKRPFGRMYQDMGLRLVGPQYVVGHDQAFDNCTVSLLEKP